MSNGTEDSDSLAALSNEELSALIQSFPPEQVEAYVESLYEGMVSVALRSNKGGTLAVVLEALSMYETVLSDMAARRPDISFSYHFNFIEMQYERVRIGLHLKNEMTKYIQTLPLHSQASYKGRLELCLILFLSAPPPQKKGVSIIQKDEWREDLHRIVALEKSILEMNNPIREPLPPFRQKFISLLEKTVQTVLHCNPVVENNQELN